MACKKNRAKAFLGALIGAGVSLAGSAIGGVLQNNANKKAAKIQRENQNRKDAFEAANNLAYGYSNEGYVDDIYNNIVMRCGGRRRKKAGNGGNFDWNSIINGASQGFGSIMSGGFNAANAKNTITTTAPTLANQPKDNLIKPNYIIPEYVDRLQLMRCGGRKRK